MNHKGHWNAKTNLVKPALLVSIQQWSEIFSNCIGLMRNYNHEKIFTFKKKKKHEMPGKERLISKNTHIHFKGPEGSVQLF